MLIFIGWWINFHNGDKNTLSFDTLSTKVNWKGNYYMRNILS